MPILDLKDRCLSCKKPLCETKCPVDTPIMQFIKALKEEDLKQAFSLVIENNPLALFTSLVCPHTHNCKLGCVLHKKGSVEIPSLENYVARNLDLLEFQFVKKTDQKVLIVGSGPAGISLSIYLKRLGIDSLIVEKDEKIGGMLTYGIPYYRLGKSEYEYLLDLVQIYDLKIEVNKEVTPVDIDHYLKDYSAVVLANGLPVSREYPEMEQVYDAVSFIHKFNAKDKFNIPFDAEYKGKIYVVGLGHVALDCARILRRHYSDDVTICYRRDVNSSRLTKEELADAVNDGVKFKEFVTPWQLRFRDDRVRVKWEKTKLEDGELINTHVVQFDSCDHLFYAIGQVADFKYPHLEIINKYETNIPNLYVTGDFALGAATVVEAINTSKELSLKIFKLLVDKD